MSPTVPFNRPHFSSSLAVCNKQSLLHRFRKVKILTKHCHNGNSLCSVFRNRARSELDKIDLNATLYQLIN